MVYGVEKFKEKRFPGELRLCHRQWTKKFGRNDRIEI